MRWHGPAACILTFANLALAEPDGKTSADALFKEGREAMRRGDPGTACPKFAESLKFDPALGTLLNLALCEAALGDFLSASRRFGEFLDRAPADDSRRAFSVEHRKHAEESLAKITLRAPPAGSSELRVLLDGREVASAELAGPIRLNPGMHRVDVFSPQAAPTASTFTVREGETVDVDLSPPVRAEPSPQSASPAAKPSFVPVPKQPEAPQSVRPAESNSRTLAYVVGAVGLASIGVGAVSGLLALDRKQTVLERCGDDLVCEANDSESRAAAKQGKTFATVSTVTFIAGGAALGVSGYLLFLHPRVANGTRSQPLQVGAALAGRF